MFSGVLGHALCTGLAVVGGRIIATRISVRTVTLVNALPLLFFLSHNVLSLIHPGHVSQDGV